VRANEEPPRRVRGQQWRWIASAASLRGENFAVSGMEGIGKLLVALGIAFAIVGGLVWAAGRLGIESLPGTLRFGSEQWGCYVPIALSILLSIVLTLVLNVVIRWFGK
jgi:hypothetical protein